MNGDFIISTSSITIISVNSGKTLIFLNCLSIKLYLFRTSIDHHLQVLQCHQLLLGCTSSSIYLQHFQLFLENVVVFLSSTPLEFISAFSMSSNVFIIIISLILPTVDLLLLVFQKFSTTVNVKCLQ